MKYWKRKILLHHTQGYVQTSDVVIKTSVFQGDFLSPLLFCIALIPLLNGELIGLQCDQNNTMTHLIYMDDLKLFAKDEAQLEGAIDLVKTFSSDINMQFGLDKCATTVYRRGKLVEGRNFNLRGQEEMRCLDQGESYRRVRNTKE